MEWITKRSSKVLVNDTCRVNVNKGNHQTPTVSFLLKCEEVIDKWQGVIVGIDSDNNRLYFKGADGDEGYKLNKGRSSARAVFYDCRLIKMFDNSSNDYNLMRDDTGLYIDLKEALNGDK